MSDTAIITCTVGNAQPCVSKHVFALVDVQLDVDGVRFVIRGVQARHLPSGGTSIHLPTYKDAGGRPQPAIELPEEIKQPLCDAVLGFLVDERLARSNPHLTR
ncbi:hypothetical protein [Roseococcus sp.]|uniref:hypothetical protein n=1 Tax=Roseococcus sp. TaxID=2109646 RepID=UPI003BA8AD6F